MEKTGRKKSLSQRGSLLIILGLLLVACAKDKTEPPDNTNNVDCSTLNPSFQTDVQTIIGTNCSFYGCHGHSSGVGDFTTYAGVKAKVDNGLFQQRVLDLKDMPPSYSTGPKSLSAGDLEILNCWIENGASNN